MQALETVEDWPVYALKANYCVTTLAESFGMSRHVLRAFFLRHFNSNTKTQLRAWRILECKRQLQEGQQLKTVAFALGYQHPANLTREFTLVCGISPRRWKERSRANRVIETSGTQPGTHEDLNWT